MIKRLAKPKNVAVRFIGDGDFIQNITNLDAKKTDKTKVDIFYDHIKVDGVSEEQNAECYQPPSVLCPSENEINGQELFQVSAKGSNKSTPKAKWQQQTVSNNSTVMSPKTGSKASAKSTPKRAVMVPVKEKVNSPYSLRGRTKPSILYETERDSDLEASNSEVSDCSSSSEEASVQSKSNSSSCVQRKDMWTSAESYFSAQKNSKSATSNRTLSKVVVPKTNVQDLRKLLFSVQEYHKSEKMHLYNCYENMFRKWSLLLLEGFSVLLYGVGSKHSLLKKFCSECLSDSLCLVINGFYPGLTIKQVLNTVTGGIINYEGNFPNMFDQVEFIKHHFTSGIDDLYIVIHNIDGLSLRGVKSQTALSSLASSPKIHFIASVDHINCSLIWDQIMLSQFQWVWYNVPTYEPYIVETSYENSLLREQSNQLLLSSLMHVFRSLTSNNQGVFLILAKYQMDNKDNGAYLGMTFHDWYQECREGFFVNNEATMHVQMSEFKNHKLLSSRKSAEGVEHWYVPVDENTLSQFLEEDK